MLAATLSRGPISRMPKPVAENELLRRTVRRELETRRAARGMPQTEWRRWLRDLVNRNDTTIGRWLAGKRTIEAVPLLKIMSALDIPPDALLDETVEPLPVSGWEQLSGQLAEQSQQLARQHDELMEAVRSLAGNEPRASGA